MISGTEGPPTLPNAAINWNCFFVPLPVPKGSAVDRIEDRIQIEERAGLGLLCVEQSLDHSQFVDRERSGSTPRSSDPNGSSDIACTPVSKLSAPGFLGIQCGTHRIVFDSNVIPARFGGKRFGTVVNVAALECVNVTDSPGALMTVNGGTLCVMMVLSGRLELTA
jgi:hypothetical protein